MAHILYARDDLGAKLELIEFDATIYENYVDSATITEHPIEEGQNISDYVKPQLSRLTLTGTITNTPIRSTTTSLGSPAFDPLVGVQGRVSFQARRRLFREGASGSGGIGSPFQPPGFKTPSSPIRITPATYAESTVNLAAQVLTFPTYVNRVRSVYQRLVWLQENAVDLTVGTSLKDYFNMLISNVSVPRSEAEDSIDITVEFVKHIQVSAEVVSVRRPVKAKKVPEVDRAAAPLSAKPTGGFQIPETPTGSSVPRTVVENIAAPFLGL